MYPKISVIIPAYNRFGTLAYAIESALVQTIPIHELIIIDDGSQDETPVMVPRMIEEEPRWRGRVRYFRQENRGQSAALNKGIELVSGEWIAFNANDDMWLPWKLEWQFRALEKFKDTCELCFTDAWFMNNPHMKDSLFKFKLFKMRQGALFGMVEDPARLIASNRHPVWVQTCVAPTNKIRKIGGFDPALRYSEDHDFLFRMALQTKFCYVGMPLTLIDRSPADIRHVGASQDWHKEEFSLTADQYRFEKQLRLSNGLSKKEDVRRVLRKNLAAIHSSWANLYFARGDYGKAREAISSAAKYDLTTSLALKWVLSRLSTNLTKTILSIRDRFKPGTRPDRVSWKEESIL